MLLVSDLDFFLNVSHVTLHKKGLGFFFLMKANL